MSVRSVPPATPDPDESLVEKLQELLPAAFPDGDLDAGALLQTLGLSGEARSFTFSWPGIDLARVEARAATTATLVPDPGASLNWDVARDVLIEGDNLQVLKLLKNAYAGQAKLIYIDPPYNTGDTFTYRDDFAVEESEYLATTGQVDEQGNATTSRLETAGRKHAPWLTMMFSRLVLARHLLRRDGIVLVSIDNNESHHLRLLMDAVFGAANFVDMMTWRGARKGDAKLTAGGQDYILVYVRDLAFLKANDIRWREDKTGLEPIYQKVEELQEEYGTDYEGASKALKAWFKSLPEEDPSKAHDHYDRVDERGAWFPDNISSPNYRENLIYEWRGYQPPANGWRYERTTMERLEADGRLIYPEDMTKRVQIKSYLRDREQWAPPSVFYKDRRSASKALTELMGAKVFDNPKDVDVIARLVHSMTDDGDLVIDFFAGSGTTGQAVWEQNRTDGKTRRWILVQAPEPPDEEEVSGKTAIKEGYSTIFDITAERLRRAAKQFSDGEEVGFRIFRTRPTNLAVYPPISATDTMTGDDYVQLTLARTAGEPVVVGSAPEAVAWEVALKSTDTQLDARITSHELDGVTTFEFRKANTPESGGRLFVSLDAFSLSTADSLGLTDDDTLILRGDKVADSTTLTIAPRLQSKLVLLERTPREVSL